MPKTTEEIKGEIKEDIDRLLKDFMDYSKDGFKIKEIAKFTFDTGTSLVEAIENVEDVPGPKKKEVVMSVVNDIYKEVNPDLPWIIEPFETMFENLILEKALDAFIDYIVDNYKSKGIFE
jgi:hypothetical protein